MGNKFEVDDNGVVSLNNFSSNPVTPDEGDFIYNSTDKKIRFYDGTQWVDA